MTEERAIVAVATSGRIFSPPAELRVPFSHGPLSAVVPSLYKTGIIAFILKQGIGQMTNRTSVQSMPHHSHRPLKSNLKKDGGKQTAKDEKKVGFSSLEVFEFLIEIGDNPSCEGAPLCMGDECQKQYTKNVDEYEASRSSRRNRKKLVISPSKRSRM